MLIPQFELWDIVNLILITTLNTLDCEFYQQIDGVVMGGPASSPTAEIYMEAHEENAMSKCIKHSKSFGVYSKMFRSHQQSFPIAKTPLLQWRKKVMEN